VKEHYLVLDQGSHASRAIIFDAHGTIIANTLIPVLSREPEQGWVEYDPEVLLGSLQAAIEGVLSEWPSDDGHKIVAVGLTTQRSTIVCWDRFTGTALSPLISWQDRRAAAWMEGFSSYRALIHTATGLFPSAHYGVSKLHWCLTQIPEVGRSLALGQLAWGPLVSFLLFRLLEENPLLADPGNASRTLLWNVNRLNWDAALLDLFSLPEEPLPVSVPNRHHFGHLEIQGAKVPMQIVMGDLPASMFAGGEPREDVAYVNVGTGAFVQRLTQRLLEGVENFLTGVLFQDDMHVRYTLEGTINGAGSALTWVSRELNIEDIDALLPAWLEREDVQPPLFLNGVSGLGSPFWKAMFESRFVGLADEKSRIREKVVAVAESIIFLLQVNLEGMNQYVQPPEEICISGGVARSNGFCQKLANLSGIVVRRPDELEATARGCAFLLADCPDDWAEHASPAMFQPQSDAGLKHRYTEWRKLMDRATAIV